jgi:hypothetical protein
LSSDDGTIDHLLGGANFRVVATGEDPSAVNIE